MKVVPPLGIGRLVYRVLTLRWPRVFGIRLVAAPQSYEEIKTRVTDALTLLGKVSPEKLRRAQAHLIAIFVDDEPRVVDGYLQQCGAHKLTMKTLAQHSAEQLAGSIVFGATWAYLEDSRVSSGKPQRRGFAAARADLNFRIRAANAANASLKLTARVD